MNNSRDRGRDAKLLATMVDVLVTSMCDPLRLGRGRSYARQGAVLDFDVQPGLLTGWVQGSRPQPYEVAVWVDPVERGDMIRSLVPAARELRFDCSCPDWEDPCKHAVAVMSAFADRLVSQPRLLALWRGLDLGPGRPRAVVGSRASGDGAVHDDDDDALVSPFVAPLRTRPPALDPADRAALEAWLGTMPEHPVAELRQLAPVRVEWDEPWTTMLDDALTTLARPFD